MSMQGKMADDAAEVPGATKEVREQRPGQALIWNVAKPKETAVRATLNNALLRGNQLLYTDQNGEKRHKTGGDIRLVDELSKTLTRVTLEDGSVYEITKV